MIIKYYEWLRILPSEQHIVYEQGERAINPKTGETEFKSGKRLSKEEAMDNIRANKLHIVCKNQHGVIWE